MSISNRTVLGLDQSCSKNFRREIAKMQQRRHSAANSTKNSGSGPPCAGSFTRFDLWASPVAFCVCWLFLYSTGIAVQVPGVPAAVQTQPGVVVAVTAEFQITAPCGKV